MSSAELRKLTKALRIFLFIAPLICTGCIEGSQAGPPPQPWAGSKQPISFATSGTTLPDTTQLASPNYEVGTTTIEPAQIVASAKALLEPAYGPTKYLRMPIKNGNTLYFLLTPRFNVSPHGFDYEWIEVVVSFEPGLRPLSTVDVNHKWRRFYPFLYSKHGGCWPIPVSVVSENKTESEHQLLRALLRSLHDPRCQITDAR